MPPSISSSWLSSLAGRFVVFDGPDGGGKTTQFYRFAGHVRAAGLSVCEVREPGGTAIGEQIRQVLLDPANTRMDLCCEMLLYMASRAQLTAQCIEPALADGQLVLADRFISSTLAYQGTAGGISTADILHMGRMVLRQCWPDLVVIFDVDEQTAVGRLNPLLDRIELKGKAYHRTVRQGYIEQAGADPDRHLLVDATADPDVVFNRLLAGMKERVLAL